MIIGIDASNIQIGGGVTHLVELLNKSNPQKHEFKYIVVWSSNSILNLINNNSWIIKKSPKILNLNLFLLHYLHYHIQLYLQNYYQIEHLN